MAINERALIRRVESANTEELARILARPSAEEGRALEAYFGQEQYERLRRLAFAERTRGVAEASRGNVVVLHGILGGELTAYDTGEKPQGIWVNLWRLFRGGFVKMSLDPAHKAPRVEATGILKRYYGEQILTLASQGFTTRAFWYDWRQDIRELARRLQLRMEEWFPGQPVHLVAHSMGGLVARRYVLDFAADWKKRKGGKLIMLGTPNHGSFAIPQLFSGMNGTMKLISKIDFSHDAKDMLRVVRSFPSAYQMLPRREMLKGAEADIWDIARYQVTPDQRLVDNAEKFWAEMAADKTADPERMIYVAGANQATAVGVKNSALLGKNDGYEFSMAGDGTVPHRFGLLNSVPTLYADAEHGAMPNDDVIGESLPDLLTGTGIGRLRKEPRLQAMRAREAARAEADTHETQMDLRIRELQARIEVRGATSTVPPEQQPVTAEELAAEEVIMDGFLTSPEPRSLVAPVTASRIAAPATVSTPGRQIHLRVRNLPIESAGEKLKKTASQAPVDTLVAGHYINVLPSASEGALDRGISIRDKREMGRIAELTRRGVIHGILGEVFLLEDPRSTGRTVMLCGMGHQGQFGWPELRSMARQMLWTASRLGKKHVATVLIGAGEGNLPIDQCIVAWVRGIEDVLQDSSLDRCVESITFCEFSAERTLQLDRLFASEIGSRSLGERIVHQRISKAEHKKIRAGWEAKLKERHASELKRIRTEADLAPPPGQQMTTDRLLVAKIDGGYSFAAIQRNASVPERRVPLDSLLVEEANDRFPGLADGEVQFTHGRFFKRLLMPAEFDPILSTPEPLIVVLDSTTARIHWEVMAHIEGRANAKSDREAFLGLQRGLTRQFRTTLAGLTQGPSISDGALRILLIADPALEHRLAGAELEAAELSKLFGAFQLQLQAAPSAQRRIKRVELKRLVGPSEATRLAVLEELVVNRYDIVHYAGHCFYDKTNPEKSGWIFSGETVLSANELRRIGQAPSFVFSNACESGITPDRSEQRSAELPASFAESFFQQGVQNFVCTGWPVGDRAALLFAQTLYTVWLGIGRRQGAPLHQAMRDARQAVFNEAFGKKTWGAYQHYGDPDAKLY